MRHSGGPRGRARSLSLRKLAAAQDPEVLVAAPPRPPIALPGEAALPFCARTHRGAIRWAARLAYWQGGRRGARGREGGWHGVWDQCRRTALGSGVGGWGYGAGPGIGTVRYPGARWSGLGGEGRADTVRPYESALGSRRRSLNMQNDAGEFVDLYVPRKW